MTVELYNHIRKKHNVFKKEIKLVILARVAIRHRAGFLLQWGKSVKYLRRLYCYTDVGDFTVSVNHK